MKIEKLRNGGAGGRLLLCLAGWSAVPQAFAHLEAEDEGQDVWVCYDYRDLLLPEEIGGYERIDVVAWSFGVWVADRVLRGISLHSATAVCGTGRPMDDRYGIPCDIFRATLANVTDEGMARFNRRMCGNRETLAVYNSLPSRPVQEVKEELQALYDLLSDGSGYTDDTIAWTRAVVGSRDLIFPAPAQRAYWQGRCPVIEIDVPHYPFNTWREWKQITC